jgi:hypothetical protein
MEQHARLSSWDGATAVPLPLWDQCGITLSGYSGGIAQAIDAQGRRSSR